MEKPDSGNYGCATAFEHRAVSRWETLKGTLEASPHGEE